jgi:hypothetical protein
LEFEHPLAFSLLFHQISQTALESIRSINITVPMFLNGDQAKGQGNISHLPCKSFEPAQWPYMWELVANLAGLKELRVKFKFPIRGWMGCHDPAERVYGGGSNPDWGFKG